jgi:hypothetical protein
MYLPSNRVQARCSYYLGGEFRNVPTDEVAQETKGGGLDKSEYAQMKGQQVYLHATSVSDVK